MRARGGRLCADEGGMALIFSLIILVMISGLGLAALMMSELDSSLSGHYRVTRAGEAAVDAGLELALAMIFNNHPALDLPLGVDPTYGTTIPYQDGDLDVAFEVKQKIEDGINHDDTAPHPPYPPEAYTPGHASRTGNMIVLYGKDFQYGSAIASSGKQPVYTVTVTDNRTGIRAEADVIASICLNSPSAVFARGVVDIRKSEYATEESIEIIAEKGRPALATSSSLASVFVQRALAKAAPSPSPPPGVCTNPSAGMMFTDQLGGDKLYCINWQGDPDGTPASGDELPYFPDNPNSGSYSAPNYLHRDVFTDAEIAGEVALGNYNKAREMQHILLGVGEHVVDGGGTVTESARDRDLDVYGSLAAAKEVFNFDRNDVCDGSVASSDPCTETDVIMHDYALLNNSLESMFCADFPDFRDIANQVIAGDETVTTPTVPTNFGKDLTPFFLGSAANPQIVFFESNMNDDGSYVAGQPPLTLVGTAQGAGVMVVNGDAVIQGSIDWYGVMIVRGDLVFEPWEAAYTSTNRAPPSLASRWDGWIMVGGNLDLYTRNGGNIFLGFRAADQENIEELLALSIPNRVLSWRRLYD